LDAVEEGARDWVTARELMEKGEFSQALQTLERVGKLLPAHAAAVAKFRRNLEERNYDFAPRLVDLHQAAEDENWQEVLRLSEKLLALAPQHAEVRRLRSRAWKAIELPTVVHVPKEHAPRAVPSASGDGRSARFILWIDGVGGFLVCLDN